MSPDELGQLIRDRLAERDRAVAGHLFRDDVFKAATDRFVEAVVAAALPASPAPPAKSRRGEARGAGGQ